MLFLVLNTALSLTTLVVLLWIVHEYIRARREIGKLSSLLHTKTLRKQMDDLLEGLLAEEPRSYNQRPLRQNSRSLQRRHNARGWPPS